MNCMLNEGILANPMFGLFHLSKPTHKGREKVEALVDV